MHLKLHTDDFTAAEQAGLLQPGQTQQLLAFLRERQRSRPGFHLAHVALYGGALLVMAALGWLLNNAWQQAGDSALLLLSGSYILGLTLAGRLLWQRGEEIAGGLLAAVAVSLVPLACHALLSIGDLWPGPHAPENYRHYYEYVQGNWLLLELATLIAGALMLRMLPFPFITLPMALALWFMSMDLSELLHGSAFSWEQRRQVSLGFGLVVLLGSLLVDGRSRRDFAFWGYLAGLLAFWGALSLSDSDNEWAKAGYCLINLLLIGIAILLRRPLFMVFGALGVAAYLGYLSYRVFSDSLLFPIVLSLIGLALVALALLYQKHRQRLSQRLRHALPESLLRLLPALREP